MITWRTNEVKNDDFSSIDKQVKTALNTAQNSLLNIEQQKCQTTAKESESTYSCDEVILTEKGADHVELSN